MKKLTFINACIREGESRTLRLANPLIEELSKRYEVTEIKLSHSDLKPITFPLYKERGTNGLSEEDITNGRLVAEADRIVVAAPFWDMGIPSILKTFIEHISAPDLTFCNNPDGSTRGNCKAEKLLYITTRGMDIETGSPLEQGSSYLKALSWLWGIGEVVTVDVHGTDVNDSETVNRRISEAIKYGIEICKEF